VTDRKAASRKWHLSQAADSMASLRKVINDLTLEEVIATLDLEASSLRRKSHIDRLIARASRLQEVEFTRQLKEKYHAQTDPH
jgi:predicted xylose isomerase-like sugar epimerase